MYRLEGTGKIGDYSESETRRESITKRFAGFTRFASTEQGIVSTTRNQQSSEKPKRQSFAPVGVTRTSGSAPIVSPRLFIIVISFDYRRF